MMHSPAPSAGSNHVPVSATLGDFNNPDIPLETRNFLASRVIINLNSEPKQFSDALLHLSTQQAGYSILINSLELLSGTLDSLQRRTCDTRNTKIREYYSYNANKLAEICSAIKRISPDCASILFETNLHPITQMALLRSDISFDDNTLLNILTDKSRDSVVRTAAFERLAGAPFVLAHTQNGSIPSLPNQFRKHSPEIAEVILNYAAEMILWVKEFIPQAMRLTDQHEVSDGRTTMFEKKLRSFIEAQTPQSRNTALTCIESYLAKPLVSEVQAAFFAIRLSSLSPAEQVDFLRRAGNHPIVLSRMNLLTMEELLAIPSQGRDFAEQYAREILLDPNMYRVFNEKFPSINILGLLFKLEDLNERSAGEKENSTRFLAKLFSTTGREQVFYELIAQRASLSDPCAFVELTAPKGSLWWLNIKDLIGFNRIRSFFSPTSETELKTKAYQTRAALNSLSRTILSDDDQKRYLKAGPYVGRCLFHENLSTRLHAAILLSPSFISARLAVGRMISSNANLRLAVTAIMELATSNHSDPSIAEGINRWLAVPPDKAGRIISDRLLEGLYSRCADGLKESELIYDAIWTRLSSRNPDLEFITDLVQGKNLGSFNRADQLIHPNYENLHRLLANSVLKPILDYFGVGNADLQSKLIKAVALNDHLSEEGRAELISLIGDYN